MIGQDRATTTEHQNTTKSDLQPSSHPPHTILFFHHISSTCSLTYPLKCGQHTRKILLPGPAQSLGKLESSSPFLQMLSSFLNFNLATSLSLQHWSRFWIFSTVIRTQPPSFMTAAPLPRRLLPAQSAFTILQKQPPCNPISNAQPKQIDGCKKIRIKSTGTVHICSVTSCLVTLSCKP